MENEMQKKYLYELSRLYSDRYSVKNEIINLNAILNLPKGTEHFISDIHGEHEAFLHIRKNASGVIKNKIDFLFSESMTKKERAELSTLIYYPEEKLDFVAANDENTTEWYLKTLKRLVELCRLLSSKYTRSKVRKRIAKSMSGFDYIIDELLNSNMTNQNKEDYYNSIYNTIIHTDSQDQFICAISSAIKALVIDHLHIVGDIFDRGPRADIVVDELMKESSIDIQWGNHDALWMGAAAGSRVCIATVLNNSITYKNLDVIEIGYGISLRPLSIFAQEIYKDADVSNYMPKGNSQGDMLYNDDDRLIAMMHKAISVIQFKLEGIAIIENPKFNMQDRLLLDKIHGDQIEIDGRLYPLKDSYFPTVNKSDPYRLTNREQEVMAYLKSAFMRSEKLQRHALFLYKYGEMYTIFNRNLLFHGCIPLNEDGSFMALDIADGRKGKELMDYCDRLARQGYFEKEGSKEKKLGKDFLWFLWCGKDSPLCARKKITSFERLLVDDISLYNEPRNAYYNSWDSEEIADMILKEFSIGGIRSHIINGHIPINKGENPIKAGGKLIVIDGGFCKAFLSKTGIGGYTLIYNANGMKISAHEPFTSKYNAIENNADVLSETTIFEQSSKKILVRETDVGNKIREQISDLMLLLREYETGGIKESVK